MTLLPLRPVAMATTCALLAGCAPLGLNPYSFSERLDPYGATAREKAGTDKDQLPHKGEPLVGDLHLAMDGLMQQRRDLWSAAGNTEVMKNLTALGLIGVTASALYKGFDSEVNKTWLRKAGLGGAAVYGGSLWLRPTQRQQIYLEGAKTLTCLALSSSPYEMTQTHFNAEVKSLREGRKHLETAFTRLAGLQFRAGSAIESERKALRAKAAFAARVFRSAERALGQIESAGPRLRDLTAQTASVTAEQVSLVSQDLETLPAALASLKGYANLLSGQELFELPTTEPQEGDGKPPDEPAGSSVSASCDRPSQGGSADPTTLDAKPKDAGDGKSNDKSKLTVTVIPADEFSDAEALRSARLELERMSESLGRAVSLVNRLARAQKQQPMPASCAGTGSLRLVPDRTSVALHEGESFQYLMRGADASRVEWLGIKPKAEWVAVQNSGSSIELRALKAPATTVQSLLELSDVKGTRSWTVEVKLCKKPTS
jgi:hypothetical protein